MDKKSNKSPDSIVNPYEQLRKKFSFLSEEDFDILNFTIKQLELGDPILVLEWNVGPLAVAKLNNPNNTKNSLIEIILNNHGIDKTGNGNIFCFRSTTDLSNCRNALPLWSHTLGPISSLIAGIEIRDPIAIAQVITGNNRILPDISIEPFFQTL